MPAEQARIFLAMALCGAAVACAYDGSLALRRALGLGRVLSGALDLAMGALSAAARYRSKVETVTPVDSLQSDSLSSQSVSSTVPIR